MAVDHDVLRRIFVADALDGLRGMEEALVALEAAPGDADTLQEIFRLAHTLKGNASLVGLDAVTAVAHDLESTLDRARSGQSAITPALISGLLSQVDSLRALLPSEGRTSESPAHRAEVPTLRVERDKLDRLLDLTGEIVIARGRVTQLLSSAAPREEALEAHRDVDRLHADLEEIVMRLRMVPLGPTLRQQLRTVRDLDAALGKDTQVVLEGEDVEVDARIVEQLRDPLTHMVRNALDHGIESPQARAEAGKARRATLRLSVRRQAASIVLEVADDGAGLCRDRIAERVRAQGLHADPERLTDHELFQHVFEPGFSTAATVTSMSGRGVGMDVVRRNVAALRGEVTIASNAGAGTTVRIRLPLTLATIAGFQLGVGDDTFVVPLDSVIECVELPAAERARGLADGVINLRGEPLPYVRLRDAFGIGGASGDHESVVVVGHEGGKAGLAVDGLYGEGQTVIKPLGKLFQGLPGIAGSAILGTGRVALILDVPALLRTFARAPRPEGGVL